MTKRTVSVGAVLFVLALVMGGVALTASFASAYTLACQGLDVGLSGPYLDIGSDSALWSVGILGSKLTGGNSVTMYTNNPGNGGSPALTCLYTLDSSSSFTTINGAVKQTLIWDPVGTNSVDCSPSFTDHVYLISNGAGAAMIDDNLDDDNVAGSGNCIHQ